MDIAILKDFVYFLVMILSLASMFFSLRNRISILELRVRNLKHDDYAAIVKKIDDYIKANATALNAITRDLKQLEIIVSGMNIKSKLEIPDK